MRLSVKGCHAEGRTSKRDYEGTVGEVWRELRERWPGSPVRQAFNRKDDVSSVHCGLNVEKMKIDKQVWRWKGHW